MIPDFDKSTLAEKQMYYYNGSFCIYCKQLTDIVDSALVYQESHGLIYYCAPCQAWVNMKYSSDQSLGTLAKEPLRALRRQVHYFAEPLWKKKMELENCSERKAKTKFFNWIADKVLNLDRSESHVAYWDIEKCNAVITELKKHFKSNG